MVHQASESNGTSHSIFLLKKCIPAPVWLFFRFGGETFLFFFFLFSNAQTCVRLCRFASALLCRDRCAHTDGCLHLCRCACTYVCLQGRKRALGVILNNSTSLLWIRLWLSWFSPIRLDCLAMKPRHPSVVTPPAPGLKALRAPWHLQSLGMDLCSLWCQVKRFPYWVIPSLGKVLLS